MPARSPLIDLESAERKRFYDITSGFMFVAASALVGRTVGDALFLETFSASDLAYMYPATAATVCLVAFGYARLASRWALGRLVTTLALGLAAACGALRIVLGMEDSPAGRIAAYLLGDLVVNLPMILFWSFAAQCFAPSQAKRLFGLVGAGGTVACIGAGFVVRPFAQAFGSLNLLLVIAGLLVGFALVVRRTSRRDGIGRQAPDRQGGEAGIGSQGSLLSQRQIQAIVGLMLVATVALTLVDYQFKAGARTHVAIEDLASFFGSFYGVASAVSLLLQLFIVHRVLQKGGVFAGLVVMPAALVIASAATWATQSFGWMVATKFVVQIFAFTIDSAALQMLYLGIARQSRSQSRALAEGIGKPLATGFTGLALILAARSSALHDLALIASIVAVSWVVLTRVNHNAYIRALADSLGNQKFDASGETAALHDVAIESHIRENLSTAGDEEVVYLLGILPTLDQVDWSVEYRAILQREDTRLKIASLAYLRDHGTDDDIPHLIAHITHANPDVREGALDALHKLGKPEHTAQIEQSLDDPEPGPRAAAIAALIDSEDLDRLLAAGSALKEMLSSEAPEIRIAAAHALGRLERGGLVRPLIGLLQDAETDVLRAALEACLNQKDPKLIPAITPLLANPKVAALAGDALAEFGEDSLDHLLPYLELSETEGAFSSGHGIPPILVRIGSAEAIPVLEEAASSTDPQLRSSAIRAFSQMVIDLDLTRERRDDLEELTVHELRACRINRARAARMREEDGFEVMTAALEQVSERHYANAFALLDALVPSVRMNLLVSSLRHEGDARNNAVEVLENVLKGELRTETIQTIRGQDEAVTDDLSGLIQVLLEEDCSNWVRIGALYASGVQEIDGPDYIDPNLRHRHPVVRETALSTLGSVSPDRARECAAQLNNDDSPIVRNVANDILATAS